MMKYKLNKRRPLKRLYYNYTLWECYANGMYVERKGGERDAYVEMAINLLSDPIRLRQNMLDAANEWFYSSRNHLTSRNSNRQAWLGRFACCYAHGISESETREAWSFLTDEQRIKANQMADEVILIWEGWHFEHEDKTRNERIGSNKTKG